VPLTQWENKKQNWQKDSEVGVEKTEEKERKELE